LTYLSSFDFFHKLVVIDNDITLPARAQLNYSDSAFLRLELMGAKTKKREKCV